ncbi:DDHD domain-containing protein [Circinella umbellata]|nr:DDHD domain-containing protein [Circinella umbellata]
MYFEATGLNTPELSPGFYTAMEDPEDLNNQPTLEDEKNEKVTQLFEDDLTYYANADHVVFVIHGIGQQTEQYGMFHTHMQSLRDSMKEVLATKLPQEDIRIKMIPIEWHRHVHAQTDHWIDRVMPKTIPTVRLIQSDYLSDVMYYFTKERGQSIIDHVTKQFNDSYHHFMEQQPNFNGKISILGYSLGGLITWDILSHQRQDLTTQEIEQFTKFDIHVPKLDFKVDYLFGMGCPLAGLLIARNQDPRYYHPDYNTVFENIYHPMDPLAFRLEPLLNPDFEAPAVSLKEANVQQSTSFTSMFFSLFLGTSNTISDKNQETVATKEDQGGGGILSSLFGYFYPTSLSDDLEEEEEEEVSQRRASEGDILRFKKPETMTSASHRHRAQSMPSLATNSSNNSKEENIIPTPSFSTTPTSSRSTTAPQTPTTEDYDSPLLSKKEYKDNLMMMDIDFEKIESSEKSLPALPLGRRYDYELTPENFMGMISNEYILGLQAHFSYWKNKDMHWHIFCRMEGIEH